MSKAQLSAAGGRVRPRLPEVIFDSPPKPAEESIRSIRVELLLFAASVLALVFGAVGIAAGALDSPFSLLLVGDWYVMTSGFVIVAASTTAKKPVFRIACVLAGVSAAAFAVMALAGLAPALKMHIKATVALIAFAAISGQFVLAGRASGDSRNDHLRVACFAFALVVLPVASSWGVQATSYLERTYDVTAMALDDAFRIRIPAAVRSWVWTHEILNYVTFRVYISISLAMVVYDVVLGDVRRWEMTKLLLLSGVLGFGLYFVVPVAGTTFLTPDYNPAGAPVQAQAFAGTPRNCMPSLHTTWALFLIAGSVTRAKADLFDWIASAGFLIFGLLTILGALAYGDHYFIDCIVAIPFAAFVYCLYKVSADRDFRTILALWLSSLLLLIWIVILRSGVVAIGTSTLAPIVALNFSFALAFMLSAWHRGVAQ